MTSTTVTPIGHWADGAPFAGASDRAADVTNPATGRVTGRVALAERGGRRARSSRPPPARPAAGARRRSRARTQVMFAFRELLNSRKEELAAIITAEHGKVLSDALGEIARGQEVVEFACGISHLLKGGHSPSVSTGVDVHSCASRSGWWASSARSTSRPWCRCGSSPSRSPPATRSCSSPARRTRRPRSGWPRLWKEAGLPDGVFNVLQGDKEAVDALLESPDGAGHQLRRLHPDRRVRLRAAPAAARQARAGTRRRQEPHGGAARRRPRPGGRRGRQRRLRQRRRALHGDQRPGRGRARSPTSSSPGSPTAPAPSWSATAAPAGARRGGGGRHGPAGDPRAPRPGRGLRRVRSSRQGAKVVVDGREVQARGEPPTGSGSARRSSTT